MWALLLPGLAPGLAPGLGRALAHGLATGLPAPAGLPRPAVSRADASRWPCASGIARGARAARRGCSMCEPADDSLEVSEDVDLDSLDLPADLGKCEGRIVTELKDVETGALPDRFMCAPAACLQCPSHFAASV